MPLIEFEKVTKIYRPGEVPVKALDKVSLKIDEGEFIAIKGPSGSGKSTLMHVMGFLDASDSGIYKFEGKPIKAFDEESLAEIRNRKVGFVFQSFYLLPRMSAKENVMLPLIYANKPEKEQERLAIKNLKLVGLADRIDHKPNELSGGQQQRVAIARALANDPEIIFADEPTGNVDSKSALQIMKILKKLNKDGRTVIMITHDKNVASYAHRVITLEDGRIVSDKLNPKHK